MLSKIHSNVDLVCNASIVIFWHAHRVDMFVHQTWKESRLKLPDDIFEEGDDYVTLPPEFFDNLWQPDPYILNSKIAGNCTFCIFII